MHSRYFSLCVLSVIISTSFFPLRTFAGEVCAFPRTLRVGQSGDDVVLLQKILNKSSVTRVSQFGPGSLGLESRYFGKLTEKAVKIYQEMNTKTILAPIGLAQGTGLVGSATIRQLSLDCSSDPARPKSNVSPKTPSLSTPTLVPKTPVPIVPKIPTSITPSESSTMPEMSFNMLGTSTFANNLRPEIFFPASYEVEQGGQILLMGEGFTRLDNTVKLGSLSIEHLGTFDAHMLSIPIPTMHPVGKVALQVQNQFGISSIIHVIIRASGDTLYPVVTRISPTIGTIGTIVTINGKNFAKQGNEVHLSGQDIPALLSADGKTLSFQMDSNIYRKKKSNSTIPISLILTNEHGSSESFIFFLQ